MFNIFIDLYDVSNIIKTSYYKDNMWMYIDKDGRIRRLDNKDIHVT